MLGKWILAAVLAATVVPPAVGEARHLSATTFTLHASFSTDRMVAAPHGGCEGTSAKHTGETVAGAPVKVYDIHGKLLAVGKLSAGRWNTTDDTGADKQCDFSFSIPNVPLGQATYHLQVPDVPLYKMPADEAESPSLTLDIDD